MSERIAVRMTFGAFLEVEAEAAEYQRSSGDEPMRIISDSNTKHLMARDAPAPRAGWPCGAFLEVGGGAADLRRSAGDEPMRIISDSNTKHLMARRHLVGGARASVPASGKSAGTDGCAPSTPKDRK